MALGNPAIYPTLAQEAIAAGLPATISVRNYGDTKDIDAETVLSCVKAAERILEAPEEFGQHTVRIISRGYDLVVDTTHWWDVILAVAFASMPITPEVKLPLYKAASESNLEQGKLLLLAPRATQFPLSRLIKHYGEPVHNWNYYGKASPLHTGYHMPGLVLFRCDYTLVKAEGLLLDYDERLLDHFDPNDFPVPLLAAMAWRQIHEPA